eukprot:TRINITY_DN76399_c0_g1_i1.p1 TRINITY_DN76399_c0_g1~~TRINITY_DN76399_c0_g1_i1.p1  ORF type:complete len:703 (+),score=72.26 TRINITY_DN76399_c0_g1_i1:246-2111(+)
MGIDLAEGPRQRTFSPPRSWLALARVQAGRALDLVRGCSLPHRWLSSKLSRKTTNDFIFALRPTGLVETVDALDGNRRFGEKEQSFLANESQPTSGPAEQMGGSGWWVAAAGSLLLQSCVLVSLPTLTGCMVIRSPGARGQCSPVCRRVCFGVIALPLYLDFALQLWHTRTWWLISRATTHFADSLNCFWSAALYALCGLPSASSEDIPDGGPPALAGGTCWDDVLNQSQQSVLDALDDVVAHVELPWKGSRTGVAADDFKGLMNVLWEYHSSLVESGLQKMHDQSTDGLAEHLHCMSASLTSAALSITREVLFAASADRARRRRRHNTCHRGKTAEEASVASRLASCHSALGLTIWALREGTGGQAEEATGASAELSSCLDRVAVGLEAVEEALRSPRERVEALIGKRAPPGADEPEQVLEPPADGIDLGAMRDGADDAADTADTVAALPAAALAAVTLVHEALGDPPEAEVTQRRRKPGGADRDGSSAISTPDARYMFGSCLRELRNVLGFRDQGRGNALPGAVSGRAPLPTGTHMPGQQPLGALLQGGLMRRPLPHAEEACLEAEGVGPDEPEDAEMARERERLAVMRKARSGPAGDMLRALEQSFAKRRGEVPTLEG